MPETTVSPNPQNPATPPPIQVKIKKKTVIIAAAAVSVLLIVGSIIWLTQREKSAESTSKNATNVIATVNEKPLYQSYVDTELAYYPGEKTSNVEKALMQKVIDDQLSLEAAQKEGLIKSFPNGATLTKEQYLQRTKIVGDIQKMIDQKANGMEISIVSVWFHNGANGKVGYAKGKEIALEKISSLYNRVKKKEITIKQAGQLVATDTSLADLNLSYRENAYTSIKVKPGEQITFWPAFDKEIRLLKPGEVSAIYTGTDTTSTGATLPILYTFAGVDSIIKDSTIPDYKKWLENYKKQATITYD